MTLSIAKEGDNVSPRPARVYYVCLCSNDSDSDIDVAVSVRLFLGLSTSSDDNSLCLISRRFKRIKLLVLIFVKSFYRRMFNYDSAVKGG